MAATIERRHDKLASIRAERQRATRRAVQNRQYGAAAYTTPPQVSVEGLTQNGRQQTLAMHGKVVFQSFGSAKDVEQTPLAATIDGRNVDAYLLQPDHQEQEAVPVERGKRSSEDVDEIFNTWVKDHPDALASIPVKERICVERFYAASTDRDAVLERLATIYGTDRETMRQFIGASMQRLLNASLA